jgi:hypothetical protein
VDFTIHDAINHKPHSIFDILALYLNTPDSPADEQIVKGIKYFIDGFVLLEVIGSDNLFYEYFPIVLGQYRHLQVGAGAVRLSPHEVVVRYVAHLDILYPDFVLFFDSNLVCKWLHTLYFQRYTHNIYFLYLLLDDLDQLFILVSFLFPLFPLLLHLDDLSLAKQSHHKKRCHIHYLHLVCLIHGQCALVYPNRQSIIRLS